VENPLDAHQLEEDQTGKVDYRSHRHIIDVVKDQELVTIHPPSEPLMGEDVFGHRVMAKSGRPVSLSSGKNTYLLKENHTIYASTGGCLVAQNGALVVEDLVLVSGDLDMSVGNIETESRVLVQGNVLEGFVIKSSQTVEVKGNVEASSITSQESIVVHGGFLGRGSGILRAKDNISCRFVNHGILCCEGDVVIEDSLMHSTITCGKTLEVVQGQHGLICGGRIRIRDKIVAKRVGARSETQTSFFMGFDYKYESQLHDLDVQLQKSLHHLHELNAQMEMNSKEKKRFAKDSDGFKELAKVEIAFRKEALLIKVELEKLRKHIHTIENKAFLDGVSYFKVTSEVFPNTKLHVYKKSKNIDVYRRGLEVELEAVNGEIRILGATS
jgi:uncharacterized protein (DUF342 family)